MSLQFFGIDRGLSLGDVQIIPVNSAPNTGVGDSDVVGKGSMAIDVTSGKWYRKIAAGSGNKWKEIVDTDSSFDQISAISWREPAKTVDVTTTTLAAVNTLINTSNAITNKVIGDTDRVLLSKVADAGGPNIYAVGKGIAGLVFGTAAVDDIRLTAKQSGVDGNAISIVYTTNTFDNNHDTRAALTTVAAVAASDVIGVANTDAIVYTAVTQGTAGNLITITYENEGDSRTDTIAVVSGNAITVYLKNTGASITATVNEVIAAINDAGSRSSLLVTAAIDAGSNGASVIGGPYNTTLIGGTDLDQKITVSLGNTFDVLTSTGTIIGTTDQVKAAIEADDACTALVTVDVLTSATVASTHAEQNLSGGTGGSAVLARGQIGVKNVDRINLLSKDTTTKTIVYTTNSYNSQPTTTITNVGPAYTVNLANMRVQATANVGTPNDNEIHAIAITGGTGGNAITITLTHNSWDNAIQTTMNVVGNAITINLANDGASVINTTAQQVLNLLNSGALVTASMAAGSTNTNIVGAVSATNLTGGQNVILSTAQNVVDAIIANMVSNAAMTPSLASGTTGSTVIGDEYVVQQIDGGSAGSWTLTEDVNNESVGDVVYIEDGDYAGRIYQFEKTLVWVQRGQFERNELQYLAQFVGKTGYGAEMPDYTSTNFVADSDSLVTGISKLDAALGANVTTANFISNANTINQNIQAVDEAIGGVKYVRKITVPGGAPTIISSILSKTCLGLKFFVIARQKTGTAAHAYIGTAGVDQILATTVTFGSIQNTINIVYSVNGWNGAASTTATVTGVLNGINPVTITINLKNNTSAITATVNDVIAALATTGVATGALGVGVVGTTVVGSAYSVQSFIDGTDADSVVNGEEIFAISSRSGFGIPGENSAPDEIATNVDFTRYSAIRANNIKIPGLTYSFTLTGTGDTQMINLVASASVNIECTIYRQYIDALNVTTGP